jgi:hypothetical protein
MGHTTRSCGRTVRIHAYIVHIFEPCEKYFSRGVSRVSLQINQNSPRELYILSERPTGTRTEFNSVSLVITILAAGLCEKKQSDNRF